MEGYYNNTKKPASSDSTHDPANLIYRTVNDVLNILKEFLYWVHLSPVLNNTSCHSIIFNLSQGSRHFSYQVVKTLYIFFTTLKSAEIQRLATKLKYAHCYNQQNITKISPLRNNGHVACGSRQENMCVMSYYLTFFLLLRAPCALLSIGYFRLFFR